MCQISVKNNINSEYVIVKQLYINSSVPFKTDIAEFLTSGANNVMIKVTGEVTEVTTPAFVYAVQLTSLSISAVNFKWWTAFNNDITVPFNISGNVSKSLYVNISGTDYSEGYEVALGTEFMSKLLTITLFHIHKRAEFLRYRLMFPMRTVVFVLRPYHLM